MRISDWSSDVCSSDLVDDTVLECLEGAVGIRGDDDGIERAGNRALQQVEAIAAMKVQIKEKDIRHRRLQMRFGGTEIAKDLQPLHRRPQRTEERRVGKECVRTCRTRR